MTQPSPNTPGAEGAARHWSPEAAQQGATQPDQSQQSRSAAHAAQPASAPSAGGSYPGSDTPHPPWQQAPPGPGSAALPPPAQPGPQPWQPHPQSWPVSAAAEPWRSAAAPSEQSAAPPSVGYPPQPPSGHPGGAPTTAQPPVGHPMTQYSPTGHPQVVNPYGASPTGHPWVPQQFAPKPSTLPVEPREYHEFLRTPSMRWWRPIAALAMGGALWFAGTMVFTLLAMAYDISAGNTTMQNYTSLDAFKTTPAFFLANNLSLAAAVPIAMLTQWACFGQKPRWMNAVTGHFRWGWFGECVAWLLPVFLLNLVLGLVLDGLPPLQVTASTGFMIAAILLTTPLQSAGEEYLLRGLGARAIGAWLPRTVGLAVSTAVTAVIFMLLHGAGDPWLNAFYLLFAITASVLAWRTGGLEASVAMHAVNNVTAMVLLPFSDISEMFNREAGVGSPMLLVQMAIMLGAAALVLWRAHRRNVVRVAAPGAAVPAEPAPAQQIPQEAAVMPPPWRQDDGNQTR